MGRLLCVDDLRVRFQRARPGRWAVDGVSFSLDEGEVLGLVGESGSGKTVTAMSISGLLPRRQVEVSGSITLAGRELLRCDEAQLRQIQGSDLSVVFQEPMTSLDPLMRIGPQVEESLRLHTKLGPQERRDRALEAMAQAELPDPAELYTKYPHELSGGMLQRVMIAAAIISRPRLLLADEPTTALDVTIEEQILDLLDKLVREKKKSLVLGSHALGAIRKITDRVYVMYAGNVVEVGKTREVFEHPRHPYTIGLLAATPKLTGSGIADGIAGDIPSYINPPKGCRFASRCPRCTPECLEAPPVLERVDGREDWMVACHHAGEEAMA